MKFACVGLAVLMALLFAACDGDDDDSGAGTAQPTAAQQTDVANGDGGDEEPTDGANSEEPTDAPDDDGSADAGHACDVLTPAEVSAAVGVEVGEGRDYLATAADATNCEWQSADQTVTVYAEVLREGGQAWFDAVHVADDDPAFEEQPVEGIGDEAIYSDLGVLDVVDGDTFVSVQIVVFFSELEELSAAKGLAEAMLEKLD